MKINVEIDCTPAEARAFFGLPDLTPLHDVYLDRMKGYVTEGLTPADFERVMKSWMPGFGDGLQQWGQSFWNAATGGGDGKPKP